MTSPALDPFNPESRRSHFEQAGQREKARKILAVLDDVCMIADLPSPRGERGVEWFRELHAVSMMRVANLARLHRPPSSATIAVLEELIRGRS